MAHHMQPNMEVPSRIKILWLYEANFCCILLKNDRNSNIFLTASTVPICSIHPDSFFIRLTMSFMFLETLGNLAQGSFPDRKLTKTSGSKLCQNSSRSLTENPNLESFFDISSLLHNRRSSFSLWLLSIFNTLWPQRSLSDLHLFLIPDCRVVALEEWKMILPSAVTAATASCAATSPAKNFL